MNELPHRYRRVAASVSLYLVSVTNDAVVRRQHLRTARHCTVLGCTLPENTIHSKVKQKFLRKDNDPCQANSWKIVATVYSLLGSQMCFTNP